MSNYNPLYDVWFWIRFWGFAQLVVFGIAILRLVAPVEEPEDVERDPNFWERVRAFQLNNRPWYYVLPMYGFISFSAICACDAFVYSIPPIRPQFALFVFFGGTVFTSGYFFNRYGKLSEGNREWLRRVNSGVVVGVLTSVLVMVAMGFRLALKRQNDLAEAVALNTPSLQETRDAAKQTYNVADYSRILQEENSVKLDSSLLLSKQILALRQQRATSEEIAALRMDIKRLRLEVQRLSLLTPLRLQPRTYSY